METELKAKTVSELKSALEKAIEQLGPDAHWAPSDEEAIVVSKTWPKSDPSDIYIGRP